MGEAGAFWVPRLLGRAQADRVRPTALGENRSGSRRLTFWPCMFQVATKRAMLRSGKYRASSSAPMRAPLARRLPSR